MYEGNMMTGVTLSSGKLQRLCVWCVYLGAVRHEAVNQSVTVVEQRMELLGCLNRSGC